MYKFINKSTSCLLLASTMFIGSLAHAALNDTGITTCSNETQNGLPCPVAGFSGQDAEFGTNKFDFTKLDANGNALSVAATNHSCVKDNVTGLMWEVKTDDGGLRDKDNTYTFDQVAPFASQVNATNLCGHNDWRMPNLHELISIIDYGTYNPSIDTDYFPNTVNLQFWTVSPYALDTPYSWNIYFDYGYFGTDTLGNSFPVRLVRGTLPAAAFTDNGDGTITDATTGLMWAKCSQGQTGTDCSGSASTMLWQQALQAADGLTLAGKSDWRLPNVKELQSLADYTKFSPAINSTYFPNTISDWFWTASPDAADSSTSWIVVFSSGLVGGGHRGFGGAVRLVRSGQWLLPFALSVAKAGNGAGSISSNPAGINCGSDCNENYASGTAVTLTATPAVGSTFAGWSSNCANGQVNLTADTTCTATFNLAVTKPTVTTSTASNITQTSATFNGTVISSGAAATVSFDFGTTTAYGTNLVANPAQVYSSSAVAVSANKTALTCNTLYHYRVKAVNSAGTGLGVDKTFTTSTCPPPTSYTVTASATTIPAGAVGGSFTPETVQTVNAGTTTSFTVTPATNSGGYNTNTAVTGTCPQGSWGGTWGNVWTTGPITNNCTVIFGFTAINAWLARPNQTVTPEQEFTLAIVVKSTSVKVGQYGFVITFDHTKLALDITYQGTNCIVGVCPGTNALSTRTAPQVSYNTITLNGLDTQGVGPGNDLQLLVIHFKSLFITEEPSFVTGVTLKTNLLNTPNGSNIGTGARGATVNVAIGLCGDADGNTSVNIVDALAIARKVVGMPPPPTVEDILADVNKDARVAITDALQIARYSVGLVLPPEVCKIGQAFSNN